MEVQETKLVLFTVDLANYTRACAHESALSIARFLDDWYRQCAASIRPRGGRIVKFIGDACLGVFPEARVLDAIDAATALAAELRTLRATHRWPVELGANLHIAVVAEGD